MEGRHTNPKHAAPAGRKPAERYTAARRAVPEERQEAAREVRQTRETSQVRTDRIRPAEDEELNPGKRRTEKDRKRNSPVAGMIIRDILLVGVILVVFAFFHHVLPRITARDTVVLPKTAVSTPSPAVQAVPQTVAAEPPENTFSEETPEIPEDSPVPVVDDGRTDWQKKFADRFTSEIVLTENSYSSPDIAISIETVSGDRNGYYQTYYVADIYVASMDNFRTWFANNQFVYYGAQDATAMSRNAGAILSMNGDYCNNQKSGFLVRNGDVYYDDPMEYDLCVLFSDGTVETYSPSEYDPQELIAAGAWQSWKFGPRLLDAEGKAMTAFNTTSTIEKEEAPRSGFGYYEPGHYCFVVADGRQSHARGFVLSDFAQLFEELGCVRAYNMDGGASSVLTFNGATFNRPSGYRELGEILFIGEIPEATSGEETP